MNKLPTGRYVVGNSLLHRLDGRVKVICLFLLIAVVIGSSSVSSYVLSVLALCILVLLSKLPMGYVFGTVRRLWLFFITIFLMNFLFFDTVNSLGSWWIFHPSVAGIKQGLSVVIHVVLVLILSSVLTLTTSPTELTKALESLIKPLKYMGVPTEEVAMILSIAIQFIPTLIEETQTIKMAQIARGARFESNKLNERALSVIPLVIPIFLSAFKRADELSMAMESRGYRNAKNRTKRKKESLVLKDYISIYICLIICIIQYLLLR